MQNKFKTIVLGFILLITLFGTVVMASEQAKEKILVRDNSAFAFELYQRLSMADGNLFFSPYSISTALAMTYAGARGNTEQEMAQTLRFSLEQKHLHSTFAAIESKLNKIQKTGNVKLNIANALWPQQDFKLLSEYLTLIKTHYGVTVTPVDYKKASEAARQLINTWVENKTQNKISDLIQPGVFNALTRLVLVNAIYFKGQWESQFMTNKTKDAPFYIARNTPVQTPMMTQKEEFRYAEFETFQMLELPYVGHELSMLILLPKATDGLKQLESSLSPENIKQWKSRLYKREVQVFLPKFKLTSMFNMKTTLESMGMVDAFSSLKANFAGMDGKPNWLYIDAILHKAFVDVNEEGTEAAAATAIFGTLGAMLTPTPIFRADHPFIFLIQENQTGSILFMGRLFDPTKTGE